MCQSVISGSLTLRNTKIRGFGMKFYFSKIRMEPVMLSFLATTENRKQKIRTTELTKITIKTRRVELSYLDIGDSDYKRRSEPS